MPTWLFYKPGAPNCSRLAPSCDSFLPVLNPVVVIPGLRAGTCGLCCPAWQLVDCVCVSKCVCHLYNKELLYFTFKMSVTINH